MHALVSCFSCVYIFHDVHAETTNGLELMPTLTPSLWMPSFSMAYTGLCVSLPPSPLRSPQTKSLRLRTCLE